MRLLHLGVLASSCSYDTGLYQSAPDIIVYDTGHGELWLDEFNQKDPSNELDLLLSIDTSCSMDADTSFIRQGLYDFEGELPSVDYRTVMLSADPDYSQASMFSEYPGYVDSTMTYVAWWNMLNELEGDSEEPFDATQTYIETNPFWPTWNRESADLFVIMVMDEIEQSSQTAVEFVPWLKAVRPDTNLYFGVVCDYDVCEGLNNAVNRAGGRRISIDGGYWPDLLVDLEEDQEPISEWPLTYTPILNTLGVFYNQAEQITGWTYGAEDNAVTFYPVPSAGVHVSIVYEIDWSYSATIP